jgi:hypothetical protein
MRVLVQARYNGALLRLRCSAKMRNDLVGKLTRNLANEGIESCGNGLGREYRSLQWGIETDLGSGVHSMYKSAIGNGGCGIMTSSERSQCRSLIEHRRGSKPTMRRAIQSVSDLHEQAIAGSAPSADAWAAARAAAYQSFADKLIELMMDCEK